MMRDYISFSPRKTNKAENKLLLLCFYASSVLYYQHSNLVLGMFVFFQLHLASSLFGFS